MSLGGVINPTGAGVLQYGENLIYSQRNNLVLSDEALLVIHGVARITSPRRKLFLAPEENLLHTVDTEQGRDIFIFYFYFSLLHQYFQRNVATKSNENCTFSPGEMHNMFDTLHVEITF